MPYPSTVDANITTPLIIGSESVLMGGAPGTLSANAVFLYKFAITVGITITNMRWKSGTTAAGNVNLGIYDANGNLLGSTGSVANTTANLGNSIALAGGNLYLPAGYYYLAFTTGSSTDTFVRATGLGTTGSPIVPSYTAANNSTGTTSPVLPATTGAISMSATLPNMGAAILGSI